MAIMSELDVFCDSHSLVLYFNFSCENLAIAGTGPLEKKFQQTEAIRIKFLGLFLHSFQHHVNGDIGRNA